MKRTVAIGLLLASMLAQAQDDPDAAALTLADAQTAKAESARDWQAAVEGAVGQSHLRNGTSIDTQRLSLDLQLDKRLGKDWRLIFGDQLDVRWEGSAQQNDAINTLKEAYLSWQPQAERIVDLGRINARYGVASGYNPTDFFRTGANRSIVSLDPTSLKKNRLGSAMLRGQTLWDGGSLTALVSPKLAQHPNGAAFSPDFGSTNNSNRWLLSLSQRVSDQINPQWLLYGEDGASPQAGLNLTALLGASSVVYVEWAGGRTRSQWSRALGTSDDTAFRSRLASGLTYTTANKISITAELEFNGAALDADTWRTLPLRSPAAYGQYRKLSQASLDLPTRHSAFLYASWQDAMLGHLDVNAMLRLNLDDHSRLSWLEARYHFDRADLALQWQANGGVAGTEFGAAQQHSGLQVLMRYFF